MIKTETDSVCANQKVNWEFANEIICINHEKIMEQIETIILNNQIFEDNFNLINLFGQSSTKFILQFKESSKKSLKHKEALKTAKDIRNTIISRNKVVKLETSCKDITTDPLIKKKVFSILKRTHNSYNNKLQSSELFNRKLSSRDINISGIDFL